MRVPMNEILAAILITGIDLLIVVRYPLDPSSDDFSSALLGGTSIFILFGLLCVFCSEKLGTFTGPVMRGGYVSHETPAGFFVFFGFLLLLLPVVTICYRFIAS
jgi:hypothetical protein